MSSKKRKNATRSILDTPAKHLTRAYLMETAKEKIPIPSKFKDLIHTKIKNDFNESESLEQDRFLLKWWSWVYTTQGSHWEILQLLYQFKAAAMFIIVKKYFQMQGKYEWTRQEYKTIHARFTDALQLLQTHEIVSSYHLTPEEVGKGKRTTTIWISPFAEEKHIETAKRAYLSIGGLDGITKKKSQSLKSLSKKEKANIQLFVTHEEENPGKYSYIGCIDCHFSKRIEMADEKKFLKRKSCRCGVPPIKIDLNTFISLKKEKILAEK